MEILKLFSSKTEAFLLLFLCGVTLTSSIQLNQNLGVVKSDSSSNVGLNWILQKDGVTKLSANFGGKGVNFTELVCNVGTSCSFTGKINFTISFAKNGYNVSWSTTDLKSEIRDCFDLQIGEMNWFGGPEIYTQEWPIEKLQINQAYVLNKNNNFAVAERYWLNSRGVYIFVDKKAPLFIDQNSSEKGKVCFVFKAEDPYINRTKISFNYTIGTFDDPKLAHLDAVNNFLGKPTAMADDEFL